MAGVAAPQMEQRDELYDPQATPDVDKSVFRPLLCVSIEPRFVFTLLLFTFKSDFQVKRSLPICSWRCYFGSSVVDENIITFSTSIDIVKVAVPQRLCNLIPILCPQ